MSVTTYLLAYLNNRLSKFNQFSVRVSRNRGSILLWSCCDILSASGLVDDVTFAHKRTCKAKQV